VIFYYLWKSGLIARSDREKLSFFFGLGSGPLALSKRWPLVTSVNWVKAVFSASYARCVVRWLSYRAALYDGGEG